MDGWLPPAIRDSRALMQWPMRLVWGKNWRFYMDFKREILKMDKAGIKKAYRDISSILKDRETDLNGGCIEKIRGSILGKKVLDAGCGKGYLSNLLSGEYKVTGMDIFIDRKLKKEFPQVDWREGDIGKMPFGDSSFDTVVCSHTLEHVVDIQKAIGELRRVTKKRLIIVVPKQRPYYFTFDLHLHFFPYIESLFLQLGKAKNICCTEIDGDWFYVEER